MNGQVPERDWKRAPAYLAGNIRDGSAFRRDFELVGLGALFDRFLAAGQCFGDGLEGHPFFRKGMEFLDFFAGPGLLMAFKMIFHEAPSSRLSMRCIRKARRKLSHA